MMFPGLGEDIRGVSNAMLGKQGSHALSPSGLEGGPARWF
jgi:hypothetical protein